MVGVEVIFLAGDGAGDELAVTGAAFPNVYHTLLSPGIGVVNQFGTLVDYNGVETVTDLLDTPQRAFNYPASNDNIAIGAGALLTDGLVRIHSPTAGPTIDFIAPTAVLSVHGGLGHDILHVDTVDLGSGTTSVELFGDEGDDGIVVSAGSSLPYDLKIFGGDGNNAANVHDTQIVGGNGNSAGGFYGTQLSSLLMLNSNFSGADGYGILLENVGAVSLQSVTAEANHFGGVFVDKAASVFAAGGSYSVNQGDGISLANITGGVTLDGVTANQNLRAAGLRVVTAGSLFDTDGTYSENYHGGIVLKEIVGDVTLVRTTADNNDADNDGLGDGLNATAFVHAESQPPEPDCGGGRVPVPCEDPGDGGEPRDGDVSPVAKSIGGKLLIQGGRFRDTGGPEDHQEHGIFVSGIAGSATLESSGDQPMQVTQNEANGAVLNDGTSARFTDGDYLASGFRNISVSNMTGAVILSEVTANDAGQYGLFVVDVPTVTDMGSTYSHNTDGGIVLRDISGDVTLIRTTADDNDVNQDGIGDGVFAGPGISIGQPGPAIGGDLLVQGSQFRDNGRHGLYVESIVGSVKFQDALVGLGDFAAMQVTGNKGHGIYVVDGGTTASFDNGDYSDNDINLSLHSFSGGVTLNGVSATKAEKVGLLVISAASVTDTDGSYSLNNNGGIVLADVADSVTLVRTVADDNDADGDGVGNGVSTFTVNQNVAIGGDLLVQGGRFRGSGLVSAGGSVGQVNGLYVQSIGGAMKLESSGLTEMEVTGNAEHGVLLDDGGSTVTLIDGDYSHNDTNLEFRSLSGGVELALVTANNADATGLVVKSAASFQDGFGTYNFNRDGGVMLQDIAGDVTLLRTTADGNDANNDGIGDGVAAISVAQPTAIGGQLLARGSRFHDNHIGIHVPSSTGAITLEDLPLGALNGLPMEVDGNAADGLLVDSAGASLTLHGGSYSHNAGYGIAAHGIQGALTLENLAANYNGKHGATAWDLYKDVHASQSVFNGNAWTGFAIHDSLANGISVTVTKVATNDNGHQGLSVIDAVSYIGVGGIHSNNGGHGIAVSHSSPQLAPDSVVVVKSLANGNSGSGLSIAAASTVDVSGGSFSTNGGDGVLVDSIATSLTLGSLTADNNGGTGVMASGVNGAVVATNATMNGNGDNGLFIDAHLSSGVPVTLTDVTTNDNGSNGVLAVYTSDFSDTNGVHNGNGGSGVGITLMNTNCHLKNTSANGNGANGLIVGPGGAFSVNGGSFQNNGEHGVFAQQRGIASLKDANFSGNEKTNIDLSFTLQGISLINVVANGSGETGAILGTVDGNIVDTDGTYSQNAAGGLLVYNMYFKTLSGTTASGNGEEGISVGGGGTLQVTGAAADFNDGHGLDVYGGNVVQASGSFSANGGDGVHVDGLATWLALSSLTANENGGAGVAATKVYSDVDVSNATMNGNGNSGLFIDAHLSGGVPVTLTGVTTNNNEDNGVLAVYTSDFSDTNGVHNDNGGSGVGIALINTNCHLKNTSANGNGGNGLSVDQGGTFSVNGGSFQNNGGHGVFAQKRALASLKDANISGNDKTNVDLSFTLYDVSLTNVVANGSGESGATVSTIEGNLSDTDGSYSNNAAAGLTVYGQVYKTLQSTEASDNGEQGISVSGGGHLEMQSTTADFNDGHGLEISAGNKVLASGGSFTANGGDGVHVEGIATSLTLVSLAADDNGGTGVMASEVYGAVDVGNATMSGNSDNGLFIDAHLSGGVAVTLTNVATNDNGGNGVLVAYTSDFSDTNGVHNDNGGSGVGIALINTNCHLKNTSANGNGANGVTVDQGGAFSVNGGSFQNNGEHGVFAQQRGIASLKDANFSGNDKTNIDLSYTYTNISLTNIVANGSGESGAILSTWDGNISDNGGTYNQNAAHGLVVGNINFKTLTGSTANGNGENGIVAGGGGTLEIQSGIANGNAGDGLNTVGNLVIVSNGSYSNNGGDGIDAAGYHVIVNNLFAQDNAQIGVSLFESGAESNAIATVSNSIITNNSVGLRINGDLDTVTEITNNQVTFNEGIGIEVVGGVVTAINNNLSFNAVGAQQSEADGYLQLTCNQIQGNSAFGVNNLTTTAVDAVFNYWGSASGPKHSTNPAGTGDNVSNHVTFAPWATTAACTTANSPIMIGGNLVIGGTTGADSVVVGNNGSKFVVTVNGQNYSFNKSLVTDHIVIHAFAGNDTVSASGIAKEVEIHGGDGSDTLTGGTKDDVIWGDAGNDTINGASGHDVLIGGTGNDTLSGNNGMDMLIGGEFMKGLKHNNTEAYNYAALKVIMQNWSNSAIMDSDLLTLVDDLVDSDLDALTGGSDQDWFLGNLTGGANPFDTTDYNANQDKRTSF